MEKTECTPPMGPPPLPENWALMTGDEKNQYFSIVWASTQGKPFESAESAALYQKRAQRILDVVALKQPDEVPVFFLSEGHILENAGIKPADAFYQPDKVIQAAFKMHEDYDLSYAALAPGYCGKAFDILGMKLIRWPGSAGPNALCDETAFQYVESEYMKTDEYDELINNPEGYIVRKYLPRICSELGGLSTLPNAFNLLEATFFPSALAFLAKGTPARHAIDTMLAAADASMESLMPMVAAGMRLSAKHGTPSLFGAATFVPFDLIGDTMRCTMGMMKDMFRHPDKILAAVNTLIPMAVHMAVQTAMMTRTPFVMIPLHKGADGFMSNEQFERFYWPSMKATFLGLIEAGLVPMPFVEGSYNQRLDIIAADPLPKGRTIWMFDRTDMSAAKEKIGGWGCIAGNVPASLFKHATARDMENYCQELIASCGRTGGFMLNPGAAIDQANPENVKAFLNSGKKFGAK